MWDFADVAEPPEQQGASGQGGLESAPEMDDDAKTTGVETVSAAETSRPTGQGPEDSSHPRFGARSGEAESLGLITGLKDLLFYTGGLVIAAALSNDDEAFLFGAPDSMRLDDDNIGILSRGPIGRGGGVGGIGPASAAGAGGAANAANGLRLGEQLARESAESVFTNSGRLQQEVIEGSSRIIPGSNIRNSGVIKELTSDGSNIADWGKYTSRTFQSPSGPFQVHYYYNPSTGVVNYGYDYKVVFNGAR